MSGFEPERPKISGFIPAVVREAEWAANKEQARIYYTAWIAVLDGTRDVLGSIHARPYDSRGNRAEYADDDVLLNIEAQAEILRAMTREMRAILNERKALQMRHTLEAQAKDKDPSSP